MAAVAAGVSALAIAVAPAAQAAQEAFVVAEVSILSSWLGSAGFVPALCMMCYGSS